MQFNESINEIETRIFLNSPGKVDFIGKSAFKLLLLALLAIFINGGSGNIPLTKQGDLSVETPGFVEKINDFLNDQTDRELKESLTQKLDQLDLQNPEDVLKMIEALKKDE